MNNRFLSSWTGLIFGLLLCGSPYTQAADTDTQTGQAEEETEAQQLLEEQARIEAQTEIVEGIMQKQRPERDEVQRRTISRLPDESPLLVYDPWEPMNRAFYNFNAGFDKYVFLPAVSGYQAITPDIVETGVSNFFSNLGEVRNFVNNLLQLRFADTGITLSRFLVNTTVGIAGLWDPATKMGIFEKREDFGQTLGYWGVGSGPYLIIPLLGPSSLRDAGGFGVDFTVASSIDLLNINDDANRDDVRIAVGLLSAIDTRKNTSFRYYGTGSPFEYELVRYAHSRLREIQIEK